MDSVVLSALGLGLALGFKHAVDPDHVAAVSAMASERRGVLASAMVGLSWGLGHSTTLMLIAIPVLFFGLTLPDYAQTAAEAGVGAVLVGLGLLTVRDLGGKDSRIHPHGHAPRIHAHFHSLAGEPSHKHAHRFSLRPRSVVVGLFQGAAGSAALLLVVLTGLDSPVVGLLYVAAYDLAVILGILLFSVGIALPFNWAPVGQPWFSRGLRVAAAGASIVVGLALAWEAIGGSLIIQL